MDKKTIIGFVDAIIGKYRRAAEENIRAADCSASDELQTLDEECNSLHYEIRRMIEDSTACRAFTENPQETNPQISPKKETNTALVEIKDLYNAICVSLPKAQILNDTRRRTLKTRLKQYSANDFKELFEKAEASDFLKGNNDRGWQANFDWLIKEGNMIKVLEGVYDNRGKQGLSVYQDSGIDHEELERIMRERYDV